MKKKTKKLLQFLGLILIISLIFIVFYNMTKNEMLDINNLNYIITNNYNVFGYDLTTKTDTILSQEDIVTPAGCYPNSGCAYFSTDSHNNNFLTNNEIGTLITSSLSFWTYQGGAQSHSSKAINNIIYTNNIINPIILSNITINVQRREVKSGNCNPSINTPSYGIFNNKIHLISDNNDIIIFEKNQDSLDYQIFLYKGLTSFIISINGITDILNIPNGNYRLLLESSFSGISESNICSTNQENTFKITNLKIENIIFEESKLPYFRFSNNSCNLIDLYSNETTINDYNSSLVCNTHIIIDNETGETTKTYYRYVNSSNSCVIMNLLLNQTTQNDYLLNTSCFSKIISIKNDSNITQIQCYKFKNIIQQAFISNESNCDVFIINGSTCGNDYYNLEICEKEYKDKNTCNDNIIICFWNQYWVYISIIATILSIIVSFIYILRLFKKK